MKLYLHNFLQDNLEGQTHYPLVIVPTKIEEQEVEFNEEMIRSFLRRIDFIALQGACANVGVEFEIPEDVNIIDEEGLKNLHHILFEIEVMEGELRSPSGRVFPIISGIPDMCPHVGAEPSQNEEEDTE